MAVQTASNLLMPLSGNRIRRIPYVPMHIPLDRARTDKEVRLPIAADTITVTEINPTTANVIIRLNFNDAGEIKITGRGQYIQTVSREPGTPTIPIYKIYLTNDEAAGGYLDLLVGGDLGVRVNLGQSTIVQGFDTQLGYVEDIRNKLISGVTQSLLSGIVLSSPLATASTPLAASAAYTSAWVSIDNYARLVGTIFADQDGTYEIQQSNDGVNPDASEVHTYTASTYQGYYTDVVAPYARLIVTNTAASAQTVLRAFMRGRSI